MAAQHQLHVLGGHLGGVVGTQAGQRHQAMRIDLRLLAPTGLEQQLVVVAAGVEQEMELGRILGLVGREPLVNVG